MFMTLCHTLVGYLISFVHIYMLKLRFLKRGSRITDETPSPLLQVNTETHRSRSLLAMSRHHCKNYLFEEKSKSHEEFNQDKKKAMQHFSIDALPKYTSSGQNTSSLMAAFDKLNGSLLFDAKDLESRIKTFPFLVPTASKLPLLDNLRVVISWLRSRLTWDHRVV